MVVPDCLDSIGVGEGVGALSSPGTSIDAFHHPIYHLQPRARIRRRVLLIGGASREASPLVVYGKTDRLPRAVDHDMPLVAGILVHDLHDTDVGIRDRVVLDDPLIIRPTAEHFAVAGIRERLGVEHLHEAILVTVAKKVAILSDMAPNEWHERLTASFGSRSPILGFQGLGVFHKTGIGHQGRIRSGENFLPPKAIKGYHNHLWIIVNFGA